MNITFKDPCKELNELNCNFTLPMAEICPNVPREQGCQVQKEKWPNLAISSFKKPNPQK